MAPALFKKFPLLNILKEELLELGVCGVEVSGSGPTLFAVCRDFQDASSIAEKLETRYSDSGIGHFSARNKDYRGLPSELSTSRADGTSLFNP